MPGYECSDQCKHSCVQKPGGFKQEVSELLEIIMARRPGQLLLLQAHTSQPTTAHSPIVLVHACHEPRPRSTDKSAMRRAPT
jgi:hypothetical protein